MEYVNLPKKMTEEDYWEICDLLISRLKNNPAVKSVYLSGARWQPGISDMDILIVLQDGITEANLPNPKSLSEKARFVFMHGYGKYNEYFFRNYCYFASDQKGKRYSKLLYGEKIPFSYPIKELNQNDYRFLNAMVVFDLLVNKLLFYPKFFYEKKFDVRQRLGWLYSLNYTLEMMKIVTGEEIGRDFAAGIKDLRKHWFQKENNLEELASLSRQSIDVVLQIVEKLNEFVQQNHLPEKKDLVFRNRKYQISFTEKWSAQDFMERFKYVKLKNPLSGQLIESFNLVLPSGLSYFLAAYACCDGGLSRRIKESFNQEVKVPVNPVIERHIRLSNELFEEGIRNRGLFKIFFPYGFLLKKQRLLGKIGNWLMLIKRI